MINKHKLPLCVNVPEIVAHTIYTITCEIRSILEDSAFSEGVLCVRKHTGICPNLKTKMVF